MAQNSMAWNISYLHINTNMHKLFTCKYPTFLEKVTLKAEVCIIICTDQSSYI